MKPAHIANRINDREKNVRYVIMAYRKLTKEEMTQCVVAFLSSRKKKTPIKNQLFEIHTVIGHDAPEP